jgi:hypothetical protein
MLLRSRGGYLRWRSRLWWAAIFHIYTKSSIRTELFDFLPVPSRTRRRSS